MPDISMCPSTTCPKRRICYRNEASGTKPSEGRQSYMDFGKDGEPCKALILVVERKKGAGDE